MTARVQSSIPHFVTPLKDLCMNVVAHNIHRDPCLPQVPENLVDRVVQLLALDLPLEQAGSLVSHEGYWRRRSQLRWNNCETVGHGGSWKQLYFERNLEEAIERFDATKQDINDLRKLFALSRRYVHSLRLGQLPSHSDLGVIFEFLHSTLASLTLSYGMKNVQLNYERALFGMRVGDCRSLAKALGECETLVHLDLRGNLLEDDKVRQLAAGLASNSTVMHLDLRQNKISDRGARALAKVLCGASVITTLDLQDNAIHAEGGRCLARALRGNAVLRALNVRQNRIGEEGGLAVCEALCFNAALEQLDIGANGLGPLAGEALAAALQSNVALKDVDVSCNQLGPDAVTSLRAALDNNRSLERLEVRLTGGSLDEEAAILEIQRQRLLDKLTG